MSDKKPRFKKRSGANSTVYMERRIRLMQLSIIVIALVLVGRLAHLQILQHGIYDALASGQRGLYRDLFPERGDILVVDPDGTEMAISTNRFLPLVWAEPRRIDDPIRTAQVLSEILDAAEEREKEFDPDEVVEDVEVVETEQDEEAPTRYDIILEKLQKENDPYEPIERKVSDQTADEIRRANLEGVYLLDERYRYYPEHEMTGHVTGFVSADEDGTLSGKYGVEGFWDDVLAGVSGFSFSELDSKGRWIAVGARNREPAQDGADIMLTIDRTLQHVACRELQEAVEHHQADKGSVLILEPKTGAVLAMCGYPDFDPNVYNEVESIATYNNQAVFEAYEPGSVYKPLVMSAAIDSGAVSPTTTYNDTGEVKIDRFTIRNSDLEAHGIQTMTQVLEKSLNTGMIHVMRQMGGDVMARYLYDYGFGEITGIRLDTEVAGSTDALDKGHDIFYATSSYGQGLTVTTMQLAQAYTALANSGLMSRPYIVNEVRHDDGETEKTVPEQLRQVVSPATAQTISAMLVSVVENGHAGAAAVDGYYIAGKTGTAQVAKESGNGYKADETIATFVGYGPARDPAFVMVTRIDHPRTTQWASATAAPLFGEIADFLLQYYSLPPER